jgi:cyclophilin family peptidyl-prolyl cis-trans isomerase
MGSSPRGNIKAEFSARKHERGILSMARGPDKDSASSQFFVMTGVNPGLDGKYSVFGKLVDGMPTLDAIANATGFTNPDGTVRPKDPQRIQRAIVIRVPQSK